VGFVYKTEDNLFEPYQVNRPPSAYTVEFPFTDVGADGVRGTADDRTITLHGMPSALQGQFPINQVITNSGQYGRYKTVEASLTKRYANRWSASVGGSYIIRNNFPASTTPAFPQTPDQPGAYKRTSWDFKVTGSYDAPFGVRLSPVLRHQSGVNFAREISIPASAATPFGLIMPATTYYADSPMDHREDNIWVFDVRAEKTLNLTGRMRLRGFFDLFNIANSHANETVTHTTGSSYLRPTAILAPRTGRVGVRFLW
jgi:hypothetical protein